MTDFSTLRSPSRPKNAGRARLLWLLFAASILLNAFFVGWWSMGCLAPRGFDHRPGHDAQKRFERAIGHIDPAYQDKVRQMMAAEDQVVTRESDAIADVFTQIRAVVTAPQFDAAKFDALHRQLDDHDRALKESFSGTAKAIAQTLPDTERIKFFKAASPRPPPK